jgi:hypothetical protein
MDHILNYTLINYIIMRLQGTKYVYIISNRDLSSPKREGAGGRTWWCYESNDLSA